MECSNTGEEEFRDANNEKESPGCQNENNEKVSPDVPSGNLEVGMEFESDEMVHTLYNEYARRIGFETRIQKSYKNRMGVKYFVRYTCNKEGFKVKNDMVKNSRPELRCGCLAQMEITLKDSAKWVITKLVLDHNHALTPNKEICYKKKNKLRDGVKKRLELGAKRHRRTSETYKEISIENGGRSQLPFGLKDCSNHLLKVKSMEPSGNLEVGMEFESDEMVHTLYNEYARCIGFETRIRKSYKNRMGVKCFVRYTCNKEGFKVKDDMVKKSRPELRCGCLAQMEITLKDSAKWVITKLVLDHNHALTANKEICYKKKNKLRDGLEKRLELGAKRHRWTSETYKEISIENEGRSQLPFGLKDCSNHLLKVKSMELCEGDAEAMLQFFDGQLKKNHNFFYVVELDCKGSFVNVFWADARSRAAYEYFCDVVTLDTTYLTNKYKLKFASFVGVNHHGQSILLGCGLLANETRESFLWLFKNWLMAMHDHAPEAIITDQAEAIQEAVEIVFPNSRHRLCLWHIMKKIPQKLAGFAEYKEIKRAMKKAVYESLRVSDFEDAWGSMISVYNLQNISWLNTLYKLREKWVPVYLKNTFWAGMSTTQRGESVNAFFDKYLDAKISLKRFLERYELALYDEYEKECKEDFANLISTPPMKMNHCYERQLAPVYTNKIFNKLQDELVNGLSNCYQLTKVADQRACCTYTVKERIFDKCNNFVLPKVFEVYFNSEETEVKCICNGFQFKGFLCRHALYTLNSIGINEIPSQYIIPRWRKDFKWKHLLGYGSPNLSVSNPLHRHDILYPRALQLIEEGILSEEGCVAAIQSFQEALEKVKVANSSAGTIKGKDCESTTLNGNVHMDITSSTKVVGSVEVLDLAVGCDPSPPIRKRVVSTVNTEIFKNQTVEKATNCKKKCKRNTEQSTVNSSQTIPTQSFTQENLHDMFGIMNNIQHSSQLVGSSFMQGPL